MKKIRFICLTLVAVMMVGMLCACGNQSGLNGKTLSFKNLVDGNKYVDEDNRLSQIEEIWSLEGMAYEESSGDLVLFSAETGDGYFESGYRYVVYNFATESIVYSVTSTSEYRISSVDLRSTSNGDYFTVNAYSYEKPETYLYDAHGSFVEDFDYINAYPATFGDLLGFEGKYYRFTSDGRIEYAFDEPVFGKGITGNYLDHDDNYYYTYKSSTTSTDILGLESEGRSITVYVYDKSLRYISQYSTPGYASAINPFVLDGGKVFIQYTYVVEDSAANYTYIVGKNKCNIVSVLVDPATGKASEIKLDCIVNVVAAAQNYSEAGIKDGFANFALIYPIENKRIDASRSKGVLGMINSKGEITYVEKINNETAFPIRILSQDLWHVTSIDNRSYLVNSKGKVVSEITGYSYLNDNFVIADGKIFNHQTNLLYDYESNGYSIVEVFDDSVLLKNDSSIAIYNTMYGINYITGYSADTDRLMAIGECFVKYSSAGFEFYNASGSYIGSIGARSASNNISVIASSDGAIMICVMDGSDFYGEGKTIKFYKIY